MKREPNEPNCFCFTVTTWRNNGTVEKLYMFDSLTEAAKVHNDMVRNTNKLVSMIGDNDGNRYDSLLINGAVYPVEA